jgi:hypothetical protein
LPPTTLNQIVDEGTNAETIYKLRNKIIHNEVPYDSFLAPTLAIKSCPRKDIYILNKISLKKYY